MTKDASQSVQLKILLFRIKQLFGFFWAETQKETLTTLQDISALWLQWKQACVCPALNGSIHGNSQKCWATVVGTAHLSVWDVDQHYVAPFVGMNYVQNDWQQIQLQNLINHKSSPTTTALCTINAVYLFIPIRALHLHSYNADVAGIKASKKLSQGHILPVNVNTNCNSLDTVVKREPSWKVKLLIH